MKPAKLGAALALALAAGCGGPAGPQGPPVLVVAIDGLDWSVLEPLVAAGRAPHFASLAARGVGGELASEVPTYSPRLWTTVATGVPPAVHGIHSFLEADAAGRMRPDGLPYTSNARRAPALWDMAALEGRSVDAVAWWVSWPAEALPGARIVASYAAQAQARVLWKPLVWEDGLPELCWPPSLQDRIAPLLAEGAPGGPLGAEYDARFGAGAPDFADGARRERFFRGVFHADRTHQRIALQLAESRTSDLSLVYFGLADVAGHYYWRWHEPQAYGYAVPAEQVEVLGTRVAEAYLQLDAWLGELLAAWPEDTVVLVVSDHGMGADNRDDPRAIQSGGHRDAPPGVFLAAGPGVRQRGLLPAGARRMGTLYDVAPTVLALLGLPAGSAMPGALLPGLMDDAWTDAHPGLPRRDWADGYRAPTAPRVPAPGLDRTFLHALEELGYAGG